MLIAMVDDSLEDVNRLKEYLERYGMETGTKNKSWYFSDAESFLESNHSRFDLVIMDIDMPGINGVDAARQLRQKGNGIVIMFVTNMPQYALAGYEVEAVDYVLKPLSYQDFALKMQKASRYVQRNRDVAITLQTADCVVSIQVSEILYVESMLHYLMYHTTQGSWKVRGSIAKAEKELSPLRFVRCNSGFLVNLRHVKSIEKEDVLIGDHRLRISRGKRMEFMNAFTRYLGGMV